MQTFPNLQSPRLLLRELRLSDAAPLFEIYSNASAMRWAGGDAMQHPAEATQLIQTYLHWRQLDPPGSRWAIERRSDNKLLGSCGLFQWNPIWHNCQIGYELAPSEWGHGYMTEALSAMIRWGAVNMQLHRIEALVHAQNTTSLRLLQRLGFDFEGTCVDVAFWGGQFHHLQRWALILPSTVARSPA